MEMSSMGLRELLLFVIISETMTDVERREERGEERR